MQLAKDLRSLQASKRRVTGIEKDIAELRRNRGPHGMKPFKVAMEVPELDERYIVLASSSKPDLSAAVQGSFTGPMATASQLTWSIEAVVEPKPRAASIETVVQAA